jgi:hypothetical protein
VRVTTVPESTDVTALLPLVIDSVVVVAVCARAGLARALNATKAAITYECMRVIRGLVTRAIMGDSIPASDLHG